MKKNQTHRSILKIIFITSIFPISIFLLLVLLPNPSYKDGFKSLEQIAAYGKTIPENFKIDTDNTIKPDFTTYYTTLKPTWKSHLKEKIVWLLSFIKITTPPVWSAGFFKEHLIFVTNLREARDFKDNFICKILPTTQSKIIIFGNVQGAFHSLTRCLQKIKELGIIGEDLKITSPDNFIIFMGDVISRSPYTMETLSVAMKLIYTNPDNVIYLRGNHETGNYWQEHTLKTELQIRAAHLSSGIIPLVDEVNKFFNTLPLACYISMLSDAGNEFIRISDSGRGQNELLNERLYAKFLSSKILQHLSIFNLKDTTEQAAGDNPIDIKVIFKGEKKREVYQPHEGLRFLAPDLESTAWTILSCPTPVYQKAIKFVHDAFVLLSPAKNPDEWKITLYNRNVQTQEPFKTTTFYLLSGGEEGANAQEKHEIKQPQAPETPVSPSTIVTTSVTTPTAIAAPVSIPVTVKVEPLPSSITKESQTFDASPTSTVIEHAEAISKNIQAIAEHTQAIVATLKKQPQKNQNIQSQNILPKPEAVPITTTQAIQQSEPSAFEPIEPAKEDVKKDS